MTTGDKLWADRDSRAEVKLGSATIHLAANTGISFLNLDDRTAQITLSAGMINVRVRDFDSAEVFEIDTPNPALTVSEPGRYRVEASENGDYTVVTIRQGAGESTGNGQTYTLHAGQRTTFSGTNSLNAEVEQIGGADDFDNWSDSRDRRYDDSRSALLLPGHGRLRRSRRSWRVAERLSVWLRMVPPGGAGMGSVSRGALGLD